MKLILIGCSILTMLSVTTYGQKTDDFCGTVFDNSWETVAFDEARYRDYSMTKTTAAPYYIPVVFHVIHAGGPENVADTFIHRVFNELNSKFANTSPYYASDGLNTGIQFCLAQKDPMGNPTTGITRDSNIATNMYTYPAAMGLPSTYNIDSLIKALYHWDTYHYLNIYLISTIYLGGHYFAGYANFPHVHGAPRDGVTMSVKYLNPADTFIYMDDVIAHEVGHYLGLYHTFQPGCYNSNCMTMGDNVCDTPPDEHSTSSDPLCFRNSCLTDTDDTSVNNPFRAMSLGGLGDQFDDARNFMDYTYCPAKFTPGQRTRMIAALTVTRHSLFDSLATSAICNIPSLNKPEIAAANIVVAPNPFTDEIRVSVPGAGHYSFVLMDLYGRVVVRETFDNASHGVTAGHLLPAFYIYRVSDEGGILKTGKIMKQ